MRTPQKKRVKKTAEPGGVTNAYRMTALPTLIRHTEPTESLRVALPKARMKTTAIRARTVVAKAQTKRRIQKKKHPRKQTIRLTVAGKTNQHVSQ